MFIHALISFFGFANVAPKPKRPPTARAKPPAKPHADERQREADRKRKADDEAVRAARSVSTVGGAADVYARSVGQVGSKPSPAHLARARDVLGPRRLPYFQALVLAGRKVPMMPVPLIGNSGREDGFADGIDRDLNSDLDLWVSIRALEEQAANLARRTGKPKPTPINIPEDIQQRLLERDRLRAARPGGGGGGRRAPAAPVPATDTPVPAEEPEQSGKGGRVGAKDDAEEVETPPPSPEDAEKRDSDDDDEPPRGPGKP